MLADQGPTLAPQELIVLKLLLDGKKDFEISEVLVITKSTVRSHILHIRQKLGASSGTQLGALARDYFESAQDAA